MHEARLKYSLFLVLVFMMFLVSACISPEATVIESTVLVPQTVVVTEIVEVVVTATSLPSATITPLTTVELPQPGATTPSASSTATHDANFVPGQMLDGLSGWCMPLGYGVPDEMDYGCSGMPKNGRPGIVENGLNIMHIPGNLCTLVFTFDSPVVKGTQVEVKQLHNNQNFYAVELIPSAANPNIGYAHLLHSWVVNPPLWLVTYSVEVIDPNGATCWSGDVTFRKTQPEP